MQRHETLYPLSDGRDIIYCGSMRMYVYIFLGIYLGYCHWDKIHFPREMVQDSMYVLYSMYRDSVFCIGLF